VAEALPSKHKTLSLSPSTTGKKRKRKMSGTSAHTYNPSYSGGEIRRIMVQRQPGQIFLEILSRKKPTHKHTKKPETRAEPGTVAHAYNLGHSGGRDQEDHGSKKGKWL
jgi:hypothetical protein